MLLIKPAIFSQPSAIKSTKSLKGCKAIVKLGNSLIKLSSNCEINLKGAAIALAITAPISFRISLKLAQLGFLKNSIILSKASTMPITIGRTGSKNLAKNGNFLTKSPVALSQPLKK